MSKGCPLMEMITGSKHPGDGLHFLSCTVAFMGEALSMGPPGRNMELSERAASGLCQLLGLIERALEEAYANIT